MNQSYASWRDVPAAAWRWPSFSPAEIACRGTGRLVVDEDALDRLQKLRSRLGKPLIVRSAYRSPEHNRRVGGAKASRHMLGDAFDVSMANHDPHAFEKAARACGFTGFGSYPASGFMHIDCGRPRRWGTPFPLRETRFEPEHEPVENLSTSRTAAGTGAAAAGGAAIVVDAATELQKAEGHLSAGTVFGLLVGGLIVLGALWALYARWDDAGRPLPWGRT
ncbi:MAG TPA: D-Ala-D-Ala carboxypeptidase family metallohydrolase [Beijerinckiaceae bacterium]|nr:D-Ala-D-Ala carboxypeptidase family metallohydrolase [Beijerinckiaceae bacterium]